jgi:hypothetical protein
MPAHRALKTRVNALMFAGIHALLSESKTWMAGTQARSPASFDAQCPAMTMPRVRIAHASSPDLHGHA